MDDDADHGVIVFPKVKEIWKFEWKTLKQVPIHVGWEGGPLFTLESFWKEGRAGSRCISDGLWEGTTIPSTKGWGGVGVNWCQALGTVAEEDSSMVSTAGGLLQIHRGKKHPSENSAFHIWILVLTSIFLSTFFFHGLLGTVLGLLQKSYWFLKYLKLL